MNIREEIIKYQARWNEVDAIINEERRTASLEVRWKQLNAAYAMAAGLGLAQKDPTESGVIKRWAKLKESLIQPQSKA